MKRVWIAIAVVLVLAAGVIGWRKVQLGEPVYEGRTLTTWLQGYWQSSGPGSSSVVPNPNAQQAVRQMGTRAIPTLLRLLRGRDSAVKTNVMGWLARQHLISAPQYKPPAEWNQLALCGFHALGTNARSAVPALIQIAGEDLSPYAAEVAIACLGYVGAPAKEAVPSLLRLTRSTNVTVRTLAFVSLGRAGPSAKAAVPWLLQCATNADERTRSGARWALLSIDPEAAAKAGITNTP